MKNTIKLSLIVSMLILLMSIIVPLHNVIRGLIIGSITLYLIYAFANLKK